MKCNKTNDLWVIVETNEDGSAKNVGLELLTPGRMMAQKQGGKLVALVIGYNVDAAVKAVQEHGADQIIVVDDEVYKKYTTDAYTIAVCELMKKYAPLSAMLGATNNGRDLGPRINARLDTGLVADCTALDVDQLEDGSTIVAWTRPAFGGNLMATIKCPDHTPQMGTVRPGVFKRELVGGNAEIIREEVKVSPDQIRTQVLEILADMSDNKVDLEGAEIIVSGGRGVGSADGFAIIRELAQELKAEVGASRAAVDSGWIPYAHQVGQTGKTVSPKLYIACGISGAIQHLAGISGADCVVAINKDPEAPIFNRADYGVVGNLFDVLPVLIAEIKKARG
ncbi:MAG: electron transfer flavoprotein subunit alpha/FixB family protein [Treponema sp.]|jgi:electron transfer flavoprotein alpha subunit|nr:electron transfer flavoprotein subunit alpha/FixB family protein [Treponema sp.]